MALTWPLMKQGSTGEDVKTVQYLVTAQGHPTGVDGDFGPLTKAAVATFQASRGLTPISTQEVRRNVR
jgi:peptidoglycan hydrolase-like protein with peptidoglycan-binding domain